MDKESRVLLQKLDCNCNDCLFMQRDIEKTKQNNKYSNSTSNKIHYGYCKKYNKNVSFIANILLLNTQECFKHRKDKKSIKNRFIILISNIRKLFTINDMKITP